MKNVVVGIIAVILAVAMVCFAFGSCGSSSSGKSSGKKWSELTKQEQDNARWAYHAKQAEEEYKNSYK